MTTNPILVALDVDSADAARRLAETIGDAVGGVKVGKQLFTSAGPAVVRDLVGAGQRVFLDLKYHDIPNTVAGAVGAATELGVWMVNVHCSGGGPMMTAAADAARKRAEELNIPRPLVIGVTVLTSMDAPTLASLGISRSPLDQVVHLAKLAQASGLDGVVASPQETTAIRQACGSEFHIVTPGIRGGTADLKTATAASASGKDDQSRTSTPAGAMAAGSSYLVIGRPITGAADPRAAAQAILQEIRAAR